MLTVMAKPSTVLSYEAACHNSILFQNFFQLFQQIKSS